MASLLHPGVWHLHVVGLPGNVLDRAGPTALKRGKAEIVSLKTIEGSNDFFEFAHELKYANKQLDKLRRELAELRKDYDEALRAPEGWPQAGAAGTDAACARRI